jgi:hypothetical protein
LQCEHLHTVNEVLTNVFYTLSQRDFHDILHVAPLRSNTTTPGHRVSSGRFVSFLKALQKVPILRTISSNQGSRMLYAKGMGT